MAGTPSLLCSSDDSAAPRDDTVSPVALQASQGGARVEPKTSVDVPTAIAQEGTIAGAM